MIDSIFLKLLLILIISTTINLNLNNLHDINILNNINIINNKNSSMLNSAIKKILLLKILNYYLIAR